VVVEAAYLMVVRKLREGTNRARAETHPSKTHPSDALPPNRPHPPQFHHLSIVYSDFDSVNGFNHRLGQSPHDLIISGNALTDTPRSVFC
jgi:hypothetical protein